MYKLPVEIHLQITVQADLFPEFLYTADTLYILWILITDPDRNRCSPIALARNGPIHIIFEPGAKSPCSGAFGFPVNLSVKLHHLDRKSVVYGRSLHVQGSDISVLR